LKLISQCAVAFLIALLTLSVARADTTPLTTTTFSDGTIATSYDHCGDTDLCAILKYTNGDVLSIYSEGAARCQPYILHFVKVNGPTTVYEYSRTINHSDTTGASCGHSLTTQMVMDHGLVHMTVFENNDGTLGVTFSK
jgi:hypothetical protein